MLETTNEYYDMESENELKTKKKSGCRNYFLGVLFILILSLAGYGYFKYYFVFGVGVKAGQLNYVVNKGYLFKTYEGKLIQSGFKSNGISTGVQSNEFIFSVEKEEIAEKLMRSGGREVELHYIEYKGALPWRGFSPFVVDSIIDIK